MFPREQLVGGFNLCASGTLFDSWQTNIWMCADGTGSRSVVDFHSEIEDGASVVHSLFFFFLNIAT